MKTALAPTVDLATPRVEKFAEQLRSFFGSEAKIHRFYQCDPAYLDVEDRQGNRWTEGSWGLHLIVFSFTPEYLADFKNMSSTIEVSAVTAKPYDMSRIELEIWLTARVMR